GVRAAGATAPTRRTGGQTALLVVFGLLTVVWGLIALLYCIGGATDSETSTGEWIVTSLFMWGVDALFAWPAVRVLRRTRRV
ncbi:insulinase family protein, partial [Streptomyces sp. GXMU-J5]|nr:insulinase family protein [Streptomyces beihaiensis]